MSRAQPSGAERRTEERHPVNVTVAWTDGHRARKGEILDASAHGMFLHPSWTPSDAIAGGDVIELCCRVRGREIELKGEVCWVGRSDKHDGEGLGLRISSVDELDALLAELKSAR
jgi:hypothetical protein